MWVAGGDLWGAATKAPTEPAGETHTRPPRGKSLRTSNPICGVRTAPQHLSVLRYTPDRRSPRSACGLHSKNSPRQQRSDCSRTSLRLRCGSTLTAACGSAASSRTQTSRKPQAGATGAVVRALPPIFPEISTKRIAFRSFLRYTIYLKGFAPRVCPAAEIEFFRARFFSDRRICERCVDYVNFSYGRRRLHRFSYLC